MIFYQGVVLNIVFSPEAQETMNKAEAKVPPNKAACRAQMRALLARLGDFGRLRSPDQMRHEGEQIWAVKARCGLRAYGFFASDRRFVVSHFILKQRDKLDPADRAKALALKSTWS